MCGKVSGIHLGRPAALAYVRKQIEKFASTICQHYLSALGTLVFDFSTRKVHAKIEGQVSRTVIGEMVKPICTSAPTRKAE